MNSEEYQEIQELIVALAERLERKMAMLSALISDLG
jgi:hypothetical protein